MSGSNGSNGSSDQKPNVLIEAQSATTLRAPEGDLVTHYAFTNLRGRSALEIWSTKDLERLWMHLHNGNGPFDFVMGFCDRQTGEKRYVRSKRKPVDRAISWGLATLKGRKLANESLAFVPYSTDARGMSRWGGFDFDAHDGNADRARELAFAAIQILSNCDFATILESSGSGGWHVWAISRDFKPVSVWIQLLKAIAREIGAPIQSGICEIFPPDTLSRGFGKGLRAPGAWNPATNTSSEIFWENASNLIEKLPPCVSGNSLRIEEAASSCSVISSKEKNTSLSLPPLSSFGEVIREVESFRIHRRATRRELLAAMIGTAFHQVSRAIAEQMARAQFAEKTVVTNADAEEHTADFTKLWTGLERPWLNSLTDAERDKFAQLATDGERAAFRIIRSFANKARREGVPDFPIARDNLGKRLGITGRGAGELRQKFVRLDILQQTVGYKPNVAAARYRWLG